MRTIMTMMAMVKVMKVMLMVKMMKVTISAEEKSASNRETREATDLILSS